MRQNRAFSFLALLGFVLACLSTAAHAQGPRDLVVEFYKPYSADGMVNISEHIYQNANRFEADLGGMLVEIAGNRPHEDKAWLEFDPFINAQMNAVSMTIGQTTIQGDLAWVPVAISYRIPGQEVPAVKVYLRRTGNQWRIANFVYPAREEYPAWELKSWLRTALER
jgi:hypothetical protein